MKSLVITVGLVVAGALGAAPVEALEGFRCQHTTQCSYGEMCVADSSVDVGAVHEAIRVCPAPTADAVTLVILNVSPDPRAPIGVKPFEPKSKSIADTFRFPTRIGDQTRFLPPTELPMWMNSQERRVAIQLRTVISAAKPGVSQVRAFHLVEGYRGHDPTRYPYTEFHMMRLDRVDEQQLIVAFSECLDREGGPVNVPLACVAAVWPDAAGGSWCVALRGTLYPPSDGAFRFQPYLAGM